MDFTARLKRLSPKILLAINRPCPHPEYPNLTLIGLWVGQKHICSVTFDEFVPYRDVYDSKGVLTHRGLKEILKFLLKAEWIPHKNATNNTPKRFQGIHFKPEISIDKVKRIFGKTEAEVLHG